MPKEGKMRKQGKPLRKAGRQNKRDLLLNAAIEVFAKKGSTMATIADVAKKARVALGTVYVYFNSKDDLLQNCMKEIINTEIATIIKNTADIPDPMDRLYAFFMHHVELVKNKPYIARFLAVEARQNENFSKRNPGYNPLHQYIDFVKEITRKAIEDKKIQAIDPDAMAFLLVGAMDIILWQWLAEDESIDIDNICTHVRQILHPGVAINS